MCMICVDFQKMTSEQIISNLFEMKESLGKDHTEEVANMLVDKMDEEDSFETISVKHQEMFIKIAEYCKDVE